ncbi:MAG TPA: UvrD-helicase domain-containing protein [Clostridiaceae bacterium]|nr:UvrD-helicase domain-containing protein [Clostridiaceae bacterium]
MSIDERERIFEEDRLAFVIERIKEKLEKNLEIKKKFRDEIISTQKSMQNDVHLAPTDLDDLANMWQYQTDIDLLGIKYRFLNQQIMKLEKLLESPYFGRIDFKEDGQNLAEKIYIGISNFTDEDTGEFLVYDWRAPISSMFYDYELGRAEYKCPEGIIKGEISLKRQYSIYKGKIERMFDCSIKIDDEILQEILSRSADSKMKTIVTTIQREQNRVIRDDTHRFLLVQGAAGSGKTSVALHRAAYLLYKYRESIKAENILIFSPSQVFSDYISSVLPELGEENINRITFLNYGQMVLGSDWKLEDMNELMEYILSKRNRPEYADRINSIKYKSSREFADVLKNYVEYLESKGINFNDVIYKNNIIVSSERINELFRKDFSYLPVIKRLRKLRQRLFYLLGPYEQRRMEEIRQELAESGDFVDKGEINARSALIVRDEFRPIRENIESMTSVNLFDLYLRLFKDRELFAELSEGHFPENFEKICADTIDNIELNNINYEDLAPVIFLKAALGDIHDMSFIKYVIIDEVQDYMPLQFEIIKLLFKQSNLTMLGDPNQSINPYISSGSFEYVAEIFGNENSSLVTLSKSYRSTKEITEFCRALLPDGEHSEYINRDGEKPKVAKFENSEDLYRAIADDVKQLEAEGHESIAVICRTAWGSLKTYEQLKRDISIRLITAEDKEYYAGTVAIPSYLAKGLEFDAVLVACIDSDSYDTEEERKLFYTVCTRALHVLRIYYAGKMPLYLEGVDKKLYIE